MGPGKALNILRYTRLKKRLDNAYQANWQISSEQTPGSLIGYTQITQTLQVHFENAELEISFLSVDLARITWQPGSLPVPYSVANNDWSPIEIKVEQTQAGLKVSSTEMEIQIAAGGSLAFYNLHGDLVRSELAPSFRNLIRSASPQDRTSWTSRSLVDAGEFMAGLGEHNGAFNLRGQSRLVWNSDPGGNHGPNSDPLYMPLPVYITLKQSYSHLIFFENSFRSAFQFPPTLSDEPVTAHFDGGALRYYLIIGKPEQLLERFSQLTGRPAMPPRWSFGYHQCRWGYKNEADIRRVIAGFRQHNLPISAIHLDIDYMNGYRVFSVDGRRFPDLAGLVDELHAQGIKLVTIINPGVKTDPQDKVFMEGSKQNHFILQSDGQPMLGVVWPGDAAFPDFTHPHTRQWWGEQYAALTEAGVDGIWHDMNEPASFVASGDGTLPFASQHFLEGTRGDHLQAHNVYGMQMNRAGYDGLQKLRPSRRPWIVSRSGWVGQARYAWNWTADVETSWEGLRQTLTTLLGMGVSGIPFSGSDIGGFTGNPGAELYLRWFQLACFTSFMRTHSAAGTAPREPWVFGESTTSIIRQFLRLRYQLLPYLYTLAWEAVHTGWPVMRPLFWLEPANQALWEVEDAFILGSALLVAPVLDAGISARQVTLPGGEWFDFWTDQILAGPTIHNSPVDLEHIPLLVRNHQILPLEQDGRLTLHLYTTGSDLPETPTLCCQIYSDAGDGNPLDGEIEDSASRLDQFYVRRTGSRIELNWRSQGSFPFPYQEIILEIHGCRLAEISTDKRISAEISNSYHFAKPFQKCSFEVIQ